MTVMLRWLSIALFLVLPVTIHADPISADDYQKNLQRAVRALEQLEQLNEDDSPYYYQGQMDQTLTTVSEAVPQYQSVQASDELCNVDNSWLYEALKDLKGASSKQRPTRLAHLIERLKAIEQEVGYKRREATPADSKAHTKEKLDGILARSEYETKARGSNALARLLQDFIRWIQQFLPERFRPAPGNQGWANVVVQILVVIVALLVLLYVLRILLTWLKGTRKKRVPKTRAARIVLGERLEPEDTATDLLSEAEALARRGDLRAAIRKGYIALLVELADRKVIALAQHKTNRDYLNAVRNIPPLHSTMRGLTDSFERHWYGFIDANDNDWQNFRSRYQAALQKQN